MIGIAIWFWLFGGSPGVAPSVNILDQSGNPIQDQSGDPIQEQ